MAVDLAALRQAYDVEVVDYQSPSLRYLVKLLRAASSCDACYAFFASEHALPAAIVFRAFRKPFVLAAAGYDYACVPERRYGLAARGRGWLPRSVGRLASVILTVSRAAHAELLAQLPSAAPRTRLAYLGADPDEWNHRGVRRIAGRVVTVGYGSRESWSRKGLDRFVELAAAEPRFEFHLVGRLSEEVQRSLGDLPPNLRLSGFLPHAELRDLLWSADVYTQLSWHESFGMSLLEAMLCGCKPMISDVLALREVAGRWGVTSLGADQDVVALQRAVEEAVDRVAIRCDAAARFPVSGRAAAVVEAVEEALTRSPTRRQ